MYINEVEEIFDSISPANINLKSFETKETLLDKIWNKRGIRKHIRKQLLTIAKSFIETLDIDQAQPKDIIIVGSIAGFNWSRYSDIDLHIVYDFTDVDDNTTLVKNYFNMKKNEWNNSHQDLTIYNYDVELYVQDINEENASDGVYSLLHDRWVKIPTTKNLKLNKQLICMQAAKYINAADELKEKILNTSNKSLLINLQEQLEDLYKAIVKGRKDGLAQDGESATGNIVFKVLRRTGHLEMLRKLKAKIYDKIQSI